VLFLEKQTTRKGKEKYQPKGIIGRTQTPSAAWGGEVEVGWEKCLGGGGEHDARYHGQGNGNDGQLVDGNILMMVSLDLRSLGGLDNTKPE